MKYLEIYYCCTAMVDMERLYAKHSFEWSDVKSTCTKWAVLTIVLKDGRVIEEEITSLIGETDYKYPNKTKLLDEDFNEITTGGE